jgi:hypothetical protein
MCAARAPDASGLDDKKLYMRRQLVPPRANRALVSVMNDVSKIIFECLRE